MSLLSPAPRTAARSAPARSSRTACTRRSACSARSVRRHRLRAAGLGGRPGRRHRRRRRRLHRRRGRASDRLLHRELDVDDVRRRLGRDDGSALLRTARTAHARRGLRAVARVGPGVTRVALIGLGEVGRMFAEDLRPAGVTRPRRLGHRVRRPGSRAALAARRDLLGRGRRERCGRRRPGADLVVSAVTAAHCVGRSRRGAPGLGRRAPGSST